MKRSQHGDNVCGDVTKTGDTLSMSWCFSRINEF